MCEGDAVRPCGVIEFLDNIGMTSIRVGNGYDVHRLEKGLEMHLCGVKIESDMGFVAHSDGDVAIHALCDALLGALALGDIGHLFPDSDPKYKGISSSILLEKVMYKVRERNYTLCNADITIALQSPKLAPYIYEMRKRLAEICQVDMDSISVKATTTERLGFVGREEGCEVWAIVVVMK